MFNRVNSSSPDRAPAVRILLVGNPGSGKTSLAHLIVHGTALRSARPTVGCDTHVTTTAPAEDAAGVGGSQRQTFVELWDIGAHERYRALRGSFYVDVGGVIIVTDGADFKRPHASVRKWAAEVAGRAKFASALPPDQAAANPGALPVPCLVINNKADLRGMAGRRGAWRRGFLSCLSTLLQQLKFRRRLGLLMRPASSSTLCDERSSVTTINASATRAVIDTAAVSGFFAECVSLRHCGAAGVNLGARSSTRRTAVQGAHSGVQQKPPLLHFPAHGVGPSPPLQASYASPPIENGGPASTSSWGGFSRTTSFHSTISSMSDFSHAWEQAPRHRPLLGGENDAGDDSADLV